ncbi:MAG: transposase [Planctomycetes bacterium]|nr:transposase [Planctomycetota bacterium]
MSAPIAYFLTWTTYGTWLSGDSRGWVRTGGGVQEPDLILQERMRSRMKGESVVLDTIQRRTVDEVVRRHCDIRGWTLHALNVRTNHVHVVVSAGIGPEEVLAQFKAWASRWLGKPAHQRWTEHGSTRWINRVEDLEAAIRYTLEQQ